MKNCFEYKNKGGQSLTFNLELAKLVVGAAIVCVLGTALGLCFAALHGRAIEFAALTPIFSNRASEAGAIRRFLLMVSKYVLRLLLGLATA
jgi:hypothetical protein